MDFASRSLKQTKYLFSKMRIKALSISLIFLILSVIFLQINIINAKENNNSLTNLINYQQITNPPELQWNKTYGGSNFDIAYSIQQTNDGGYIVAGWTESFGHGSSDVYILKLDSNGNLQWNKTYGGIGFDNAYSIQQTRDGGYIVAGETSSFVNPDAYILKLDSNGNIQWYKTYGGSNYDAARSIQQTNDGGYIVAGWTETWSFGHDWDVYILKLDSNGNLQWNKTYGGILPDWAYSIQQTRDGGYIVAGYTESFGHDWDVYIHRDVYILKLDSNGNLQWNKTYGGPGGDDEAYSIQQTRDGGYIVAGYTKSFGHGNYDVYILKLDSNGNLQWNKTYGGIAYSIQQTRDGGYIVAGYTYSFSTVSFDVYILKLDSNGNLQWNKTYGGYGWDGATSIQQTRDGGYIVAGYTYSFGHGNYDVYILKLAPETDKINLSPEFANMTSILSPPVVKVGEEFTLAIPVFYSFHASTGVTLTLRSLDSNKETSQSKSLEGDGLELYTYKIEPEFMGSKSPGVKSFEAILRVGYPEEGYRTASEEKLRFNVIVAENAGNSAIIPMWGYKVELEYRGEKYWAFMAYNASSPLNPNSTNFIDVVNWAYSHHNWLVFRVTNEGLEIVMNDTLYKILAWAAEIVKLRISSWHLEYLSDEYDRLINLKNLAIGAETALFFFKLFSKLLSIIVSAQVGTLETSVASSLGAYKIIDLSLKIDRIIELLRFMNFYEKLLDAINMAGEVVENTLAWLSIMLINDGANKILEANKLLRDVGFTGNVPVSLHANAEEALNFYKLFSMGESMASAGIKFLAARYAEQGPMYLVKTVILDLTGAIIGNLINNVDEFYEALENPLSAKDVIEFAQYFVMAMEEYEIRSLTLQNKALKFRDAYIQDTSNSIKITMLKERTAKLMEAAGRTYGQELESGLYLTVIDSNGMISGIDPISGSIKAEIRGSYLIDGGDIVMVIVPLNTTIKSIKVVSTNPESLTDRFKLRVEVGISGEVSKKSEISGQLEGGKELSYSLKLSDNLEPIIVSMPEEKGGLGISLYYLIIIIGIVAVAVFLVYVVIKRRK